MHYYRLTFNAANRKTGAPRYAFIQRQKPVESRDDLDALIVGTQVTENGAVRERETRDADGTYVTTKWSLATTRRDLTREPEPYVISLRYGTLIPLDCNHDEGRPCCAKSDPCSEHRSAS
jgi:hypothetical protein